MEDGWPCLNEFGLDTLQKPTGWDWTACSLMGVLAIEDEVTLVGQVEME
jgi:hypothetical protein